MEEEKNILIVEDEQVIAMDLKKTISNFGYNVLSTVSSGEEALNFMTGNKPNLVIMDILLAGDLNGIETGVIMSERFNVPIIYITAYAKEILLRSKITESSTYLVKPFDESELQKKIEKVLSSSSV
ncbi:MAG: response regulator [Ignavibacteriaceae bacterium]|jgi:two-component SAPR family response regulator